MKEVLVKQLDTKVKPWRKGRMGHIILPITMRNKIIRVALIDNPSDHIEIWARNFGNSSHITVDHSWIGKDVSVKVVDG